MKRIQWLVAFVVLAAWVSALASTGAIMSYPKFKAWSTTGKLLAGGKLYSYYPYSSTPKDLYSNKSMTVKHTNPVVLDTYGEAAIWGAGPYKLVLKTSADVTLWSMDFVNGIGGTDGNSTLYPELYGAIGDGTTDDTAAIEATITACPATGCRIVLTQVYRTVSDENMTSRAEYIFNQGGKLDPDTGTTVTFPDPNKIVARPDQELFTGAGLIKFTAPGTVYADWWGADKGGVNDAYADLNATIESVPRNSTVVLNKGIYLISEGINIRTTSINVHGVCGASDTSGTVIKADTGLAGGVLFNWEPPMNTLGTNTIECLYLDGNSQSNIGLRLVHGEGLRYRGIHTRWNLVAGVEYDGDVPTYYVSGVTSNLYNVTCQDSTSDWNPVNWWIHRDWDDANGKVFTNFHFKNCSGSHASGQANVLLDGGNSTSASTRTPAVNIRGFVVDWDGGSFQAMEDNETTNGLGIQPSVVWAQDGVTLTIQNVYSEKANAGWLEWYLKHKSGAVVQGGGNMGIYDDSYFGDNGTLCADYGTLASTLFYKGKKQTLCVGDVISDKETYGSPNFPSGLYGTDCMQYGCGGYLAFKGDIATDNMGTRWLQVEDDFHSDPLATYRNATRSGYNRWSPMDGRIIIKFDYNTLNLGNRVMWFAEADFVITGMDVVITKTFTSSQSTGCGETFTSTGAFAVGNVPKREKFISTTQLDIANLTEGTVIRAWDNDNATTGVLRWSYTSTSTSTSATTMDDQNGTDGNLTAYTTTTTTTTTTGNHLARHMKGYHTQTFTEHPTWSDNSTTDYENSYVMFTPCPYTDCITCDGVWTDGEGFLVITGYPLEYN